MVIFLIFLIPYLSKFRLCPKIINRTNQTNILSVGVISILKGHNFNDWFCLIYIINRNVRGAGMFSHVKELLL